MLVNCNSCQKKFNVPDSAITEGGRLLQCGSCGNKWTQFPIKTKSVEKIEKISPTKLKQPSKSKKIKTAIKKKKREINLYSEEYLKKKHGLEIKEDEKSKKIKKNTSGLTFLNYIIILFIIIITFFGILNQTKDILIINYPITETYINTLYEIIKIFKFTIFNLIN